MTTTKRTLFGGALFSAGMAFSAMTGTAHADQTLPFDPAGISYARAYFLAQPFEGLGQVDNAYNVVPGGGPTGLQDVGWLNYWGSGTVNAEVTDKAIESSASWAYDPTVGFVGVFGLSLAYLMADVDTTLQLSWTNDGAYANAYVLDATFTRVFDGYGYGPSGEGMFTLEAGEMYIAVSLVASGTVESLSPQGDPGFVEASGAVHISVVPAPGAFALLGMAGVCTGRRRRRE